MRGWLQIQWRGDIEKAYSVFSEARKVPGLQDGTAQVAINSFRVALIRKDFRDALRQLDGEKREALSNQSNFFPIDLLRGEALVSRICETSSGVFALEGHDSRCAFSDDGRA
jgi:hypothetical protein